MTKHYTEYIVTDAILLDKQESFTSKKCKFIFKMKLFNPDTNNHIEDEFVTTEEYDFIKNTASDFLTGKSILVEDCAKPQTRKKFKLKIE